MVLNELCRESRLTQGDFLEKVMSEQGFTSNAQWSGKSPMLVN